MNHMQVHRQRETAEDYTKDSKRQKNPEDLTLEDFIFPQLVRPGLGRVCDYCNLKNGYSVAFTSFNQYLEHVCKNHEGYSVYAFSEELERFRTEILRFNQKIMKHPKQLRQPNLPKH